MSEQKVNLAVEEDGGAETAILADGASRLLHLAELALDSGAEPVAEEARELPARVAEGRFYVACVGQFKRGKSTLINVLIGHEVLPTGFVRVTAVREWIDRLAPKAWAVVAAGTCATYGGIHANGMNLSGTRFGLYGAARCPHTQEMRDWLEFRRCEFVEYDVEADPVARRRMHELSGGQRKRTHPD